MRFVLIFFLLSSLFSFSQNDTLIDNGIYEVYYSYSYKSPIWVKYSLSNGGGDCNRSKFNFIKFNRTASNEDFIGSGFDKGHLVPAEDFAYDCNLEKKTFYFYNVVAQYPNMNRGIWKSYEEKVRDLSKKEPIDISCGCFYSNDKIENTDVSIPTSCWKIAKSKNGKVLISIIVTNNPNKNSIKKVPISQIDSKLKSLRYKP